VAGRERKGAIKRPADLRRGRNNLKERSGRKRERVPILPSPYESLLRGHENRMVSSRKTKKTKSENLNVVKTEKKKNARKTHRNVNLRRDKRQKEQLGTGQRESRKRAQGGPSVREQGKFICD